MCEEAMIKMPPTPPRDCMEAARWMLLEAALKDLPLQKMESLNEKSSVCWAHTTPCGGWRPQQEVYEGGL
jgi:hypothetical protein